MPQPSLLLLPQTGVGRTFVFWKLRKGLEGLGIVTTEHPS
jgi:hypothetical protein